MSDYPKVKVSNAPGYEDFEGELIMEAPSADGNMMSVVGWDKNNPYGFDVFLSEHVTIIEENK